MLQESAIIPTGTASLSTTSRQIKKLATNVPDDNGLMAKEKQTRKRSPRIAVTWMKPCAKTRRKGRGWNWYGQQI
jgi:hypothetical protein